MSSIFYRYLRPQQYSFQWREIRTLQKGGICFRVEQQLEHAYLTYSICHPEETFSKDVARRIADDRRVRGFGFYISNEATSEQRIYEEVVQVVDAWNDAFNKSLPYTSAREFYQHTELRLLCTRCQEIWASRLAVQHLNMLDHDVIDALNLRKMYEVRNG